MTSLPHASHTTGLGWGGRHFPQKGLQVMQPMAGFLSRGESRPARGEAGFSKKNYYSFENI